MSLYLIEHLNYIIEINDDLVVIFLFSRFTHKHRVDKRNILTYVNIKFQ